MGRNASIFCHLFLADDCLLFLQDYQSSLDQLLHLLKVYEEASGHKINVVKSFVFFSKNVTHDCRCTVLSNWEWGCALGKGLALVYLVYLDDPRSNFFPIWRRDFGRKLIAWGKNSSLMVAKKFWSNKSFNHSLCMQCQYVIYSHLFARICAQLLEGFGGNPFEERQDTTWVSWNNLCKPKKDEGVGFCHFNSLIKLSLLNKDGNCPNIHLCCLHEYYITNITLILISYKLKKFTTHHLDDNPC